jgi:hypothetical protein
VQAMRVVSGHKNLFSSIAFIMEMGCALENFEEDKIYEVPKGSCPFSRPHK